MILEEMYREIENETNTEKRNELYIKVINELYSELSQLTTAKIEPVATQQLPDGSTAIVIPVGVEKETTPPSENEFAEALDAAEQECCRKKAPCKHWAWDPVRMMYVNSLSGRGKVEDE